MKVEDREILGRVCRSCRQYGKEDPCPRRECIVLRTIEEKNREFDRQIQNLYDCMSFAYNDLIWYIEEKLDIESLPQEYKSRLSDIVYWPWLYIQKLLGKNAGNLSERQFYVIKYIEEKDGKQVTKTEQFITREAYLSCLYFLRKCNNKIKEAYIGNAILGKTKDVEIPEWLIKETKEKDVIWK